MFRSVPTQAAILLLAGPALLSACSHSPAPNPSPAPTVGVAAPVAAKPAEPRVFTLDTPVKRIAADPQGKAVLERDVPGLMENKNYPLFDDMSLSELAPMSHGRLTKSELAMVQTDLAQLSSQNP